MGKHKVFIYTKLHKEDQKEGYDYADGGGFGMNINHRPMVGDVIVDLEDGHPSQTLVIENLILLREEISDDETSYWHAYCDSVGFDFSLPPYYGKSGDYAKLAAHAVDQRSLKVRLYGVPEYYDDNIESYRDKCKSSVKEYLARN